MKTVREFHDAAMVQADKAEIMEMFDGGKTEESIWHWSLACDFESRAAGMVEVSPDSEPTRGILYRSAAWLSVRSLNFDLAKYLAHEGLVGVRELWQVKELNDVLTHIKLQEALW